MAESSTITITLNGEPYRLEADASLAGLLAALKVRPNRIAVEINREVVPKARYHEVVLRPGDQVEVINFVGGG